MGLRYPIFAYIYHKTELFLKNVERQLYSIKAVLLKFFHVNSVLKGFHIISFFDGYNPIFVVIFEHSLDFILVIKIISKIIYHIIFIIRTINHWG
jgi:hypothetical protein